MLLVDGIKLYHGSYVIVKEPDLAKCAKGKDFGRGFYVTTDRDQAARFTRTSIAKAKANGVIGSDYMKGFVTTYTYDHHEQLNFFEFTDTDSRWLHCVVAHRRQRDFAEIVGQWKDYDIICGKIANDNTNLVITAYTDGVYGEMMTERADEIAISFLEPQNLKNQICFRTKRSLECIKYAGYEEIVL